MSTIQDCTISRVRSLFDKFKTKDETYSVTCFFDIGIYDEEYPGMGVNILFYIVMKMGKDVTWDEIEKIIIEQLSRDDVRNNYSSDDRTMTIDPRDVEMMYTNDSVEPKNKNS